MHNALLDWILCVIDNEALKSRQAFIRANNSDIILLADPILLCRKEFILDLGSYMLAMGSSCRYNP